MVSTLKAKPTKIVFLDYDGVICHFMVRYSLRGKATGRVKGFDQHIMQALQRFQEITGVVFVCSSRAHRAKTYQEQIKPWIDHNAEVHFHKDWCTPYMTRYDHTVLDAIPDALYEALASGYPFVPTVRDWSAVSKYRGWCIREWLEDHPEIGPNDYVVIDDESDMFPIPRDRFLHIQDGELGGGMGMRHLVELAKMLDVSLL